jgi:hypothetical protein
MYPLQLWSDEKLETNSYERGRQKNMFNKEMRRSKARSQVLTVSNLIGYSRAKEAIREI